MDTVYTRPLGPEDWTMFRDVRLAALQSSPGMFSGTYADSLQRSAEKWQQMTSGSNHQVWGLFDDTTPIGITAVFETSTDPRGDTAMLAMSFILPAYRGRGLSRLLYDVRLAWLRQHPRFKRAVISHRQSNQAARRASLRSGFIETGRAACQWPDGTSEDEIRYELALTN